MSPLGELPAEQRKRLQALQANAERLSKLFIESQVTIAQIFQTKPDRVGDVLDILKKLHPEMVEAVPTRKLQEAIASAESISQAIDRILHFDPTPYREQGYRRDADIIMREFLDQVDAFDTKMLHVMAYYGSSSKSEQFISTMLTMEQFRQSAEAKAEEIHKTLEAVQTSTSQLGIQNYAKVFADEYERYKRNSWVWLGAFCTAIVAGVWTIWYYVDTCQPVKDDSGKVPLLDLVNFLGVKVLLIAVFFLVVTLTLRNYFAAKHNAILNKHRACSMQSFELFVHGASDDSTKDAIRRIAAESIFAVQKSGMLGKDQAPPNPVSVSAFSVPNK